MRSSKIPQPSRSRTKRSSGAWAAISVALFFFFVYLSSLLCYEGEVMGRSLSESSEACIWRAFSYIFCDARLTRRFQLGDARARFDQRWHALIFCFWAASLFRISFPWTGAYWSMRPAVRGAVGRIFLSFKRVTSEILVCAASPRRHDDVFSKGERALSQ